MLKRYDSKMTFKRRSYLWMSNASLESSSLGMDIGPSRFDLLGALSHVSLMPHFETKVVSFSPTLSCDLSSPAGIGSFPYQSFVGYELSCSFADITRYSEEPFLLRVYSYNVIGVAPSATLVAEYKLQFIERFNPVYIFGLHAAVVDGATRGLIEDLNQAPAGTCRITLSSPSGSTSIQGMTARCRLLTASSQRFLHLLRKELSKCRR